MECLKTDRMLRFRPDTLEFVRKDLNLEQPGRVAEAIDILEDWVQKQPHFVKKDFSRDYLERILVTAKGLVERAKKRLDKLCTFKTLMPEFFTINDANKEFEPLSEVMTTAHLPQMTPQHQRVYMIKILSDNVDSSAIFSFYKYMIALSEYFFEAEYCTGFHIVMDCSDSNILSFVTKINPIELRQIITLMTEGYGCRIKGIHVISSSKMVDTLITLLKQVFSAKLTERIHLHKTFDTLSEYLPTEIMPAEYGGEEKTLLELNKAWLEVISSKEFVDYLKEMNKASTNESCRPGEDWLDAITSPDFVEYFQEMCKAKTDESFRQADKFTEQYVDMPGSFRALSID